MDETLFNERRSERLRRREAARIAHERHEAVMDALVLMAPLLAMWALCWAVSYAMSVMP